MMNRRWTLLLTGAVALTGCSADAVVRDVAEPVATTRAVAATGETTPAPSAAETTTPSVPTGETLPVIGGGAFPLEQLEQGPLALWFWAPG